VTVTEEFIEYLTEGAVAIEVFGHRQADPGRNPALWDLSIIQAKTRTLRDRYEHKTQLQPPLQLTNYANTNVENIVCIKHGLSDDLLLLF